MNCHDSWVTIIGIIVPNFGNPKGAARTGSSGLSPQGIPSGYTRPTDQRRPHTLPPPEWSDRLDRGLVACAWTVARSSEHESKGWYAQARAAPPPRKTCEGSCVSIYAGFALLPSLVLGVDRRRGGPKRIGQSGEPIDQPRLSGKQKHRHLDDDELMRF